MLESESHHFAFSAIEDSMTIAPSTGNLNSGAKLRRTGYPPMIIVSTEKPTRVIVAVVHPLPARARQETIVWE